MSASTVNPDWAKLPLFDRTGWERVRFGDVVENFNETARNPAETGIEQFIGLEHLEPGSLHVRAWGNVADGTTFTRRCRPDQVLFGKRRAYQRKVAVAEFDAVVSGDIYVLAPNNDLLLPELLPFLCMSERFFQHAVGTSAGSLSPRTNWSSLAAFEFDLPPLAQQRRIAEILWAVDEAIERNIEMADAAAAAKAAWLSEQIPVAPRTGNPREDLLKLSNGKWRLVRLGDVARTVGGSGFPHAHQGRKQGPMPFYKVSDMNSSGNEYVLISAANYIDFDQQRSLKARIVPRNAVVFPKVGAALLTNKRRLTSVDCCMDNNMMAVVSESVPPEYLLEFLNRIDFASIVQMGAVPSVNQSQVEALVFPVLQETEYAAFKAKLAEYYVICQAASEHLGSLRAVLRELTGRIMQS